MSAITRRTALCGIASLPALGGAIAAIAAIPASADPWTRARALAAEIKTVLGEIDGVHGVDVSVALDHGNRVTLLPARPVKSLIRDHKRAAYDFGEACDATDKVRIGREPTKAAWRRWRSALNADRKAMQAILSHVPDSPADAAAKARYLTQYNNRVVEFDRHEVDLLLRSIGRAWA